jgi:hypothetical protein
VTLTSLIFQEILREVHGHDDGSTTFTTLDRCEFGKVYRKNYGRSLGNGRGSNVKIMITGNKVSTTKKDHDENLNLGRRPLYVSAID